VRTITAQIIKTGKVQHAFLGVGTQAVTPQLARLFNLPVQHGLLVADVQSGSAADKAGIKEGKTSVIVGGESYQLGGDIITAVDGKPVTTETQLSAVISTKKPGDHLQVTLVRSGKTEKVDVTLGSR
jgi:S1-C subfamily serine protease